MNRQKDYHKEYYQRPEVKKHRRAYHSTYHRERNRVLRKQFFELYGGVCVCCGESDKRFLTLDHVNGNGKADRRKRCQSAILGDAIANLDTDKYQILCYNCNLGRSANNGICPHKASSDSTNLTSPSKDVRRRRRLRLRLFEVYGPICACCGETEKRFLTLDHKLSDGNVAREQSKDHKIMRKAITEADPKKYQVLCFNCNCVRSQYNGVCPHQVSDVSLAILSRTTI